MQKFRLENPVRSTRFPFSVRSEKKRKYIVKGLELDGKPRKMSIERNKPVEKSQPVQEDNLFKQTGCSGNFPIGSTLIPELPESLYQW